VAYINMLSFGAEAAEEACRHDIAEPFMMLCSSEHKLFGSTFPECKLIASPILGDNHFGSSPNLRVYQGELFEAILLREFFNNIMTEVIWILDELLPEGTISSDMGKQPEVVFKVSSLAVHNTLVMPSDNTSAFLYL